MKRIMNIVIAAEIILLASCGAGASTDTKTELTAKKTALEKLKSDQAKIGDQITKLEADIAKLDPSSATGEKAKLVTTSILAVSSFTHYIDLQGRIDAINISYIAPRNGTGGLVKAVYVKKGDVVKKGQLLLQLDDIIMRQSLSASEQNLAAIKSQLDLSQDLYKRRKNLLDQGIGTEVDVITAKRNAENLERQYNAQQENVKNAQEQLKFTSVYSDVDGVADDVNIRVGELFTGVVQGSPPTPQIKIVNTSNLKVTTQIPENYLGKVNVGSHIIVNLPDINKTIDAIVTVASPLIDNSSRTFYIEAKIPANKDFHPNQVALVKIQDYASPNALTAPLNTLQTDDKGKFIMVAVQENDKLVARKKVVKIGELYGDKVEIKSGLQAGDAVITDGFQSLYDGQLITTDTK